MSPTTLEAVDAATPPYDEQELELHVQRVAQSAQFMRAETLKKLLLYLWVHRNEEISEYAVATEALGRRADFDPKTDASVRVQISRLRRKLKDFYETEGVGGAHLLHIPMGTHVLTVLDDSSYLSMPSSPEQEVARFSIKEWGQPLLGMACVALTILSAWLLWDRHKLAGSVQRPVVQPARFWTSFLGAGAPVKIILPTPVFFVYPKIPNVHVRDIVINDFESWRSSETVTSLAKNGGDPTLDHSYTVTSDTLAAIDLAHYLDAAGVADRVAFEVTGESSMNLLEKANVVALGAHSTLHPFRDYLASMNFTLGPNEAWVENAHPVAGELQRYAVVSQSVGRQVEPAIIAVLPGRSPNLKLLILQSRHTSALVGMLTSKIGNSLFEKIYAAHGSPAYFEMVVESETDGDHVIRSWPVALHAYTKNAPTGADVTQ
jgi:hypothetical protein